MSSPSKRRDMDVMKLMVSDFEVSLGDANCPRDFYVKFFGPKDSPYEGGIWKVHVTLPQNYPYSSPSIGFCNTIYHPNVDLASGSVCLDVINQTWSPMFDLVNVFSAFLPQLLLYPNPSDPLNGEAAILMIQDKNAYGKRVQEYVKKFASVDFRLKELETDETPRSRKASNLSESRNSSRSVSVDVDEMDNDPVENDDLSDLDDDPDSNLDGDVDADIETDTSSVKSSSQTKQVSSPTALH